MPVRPVCQRAARVSFAAGGTVWVTPQGQQVFVAQTTFACTPPPPAAPTVPTPTPPPAKSPTPPRARRKRRRPRRWKANADARHRCKRRQRRRHNRRRRLPSESLAEDAGTPPQTPPVQTPTPPPVQTPRRRRCNRQRLLRWIPEGAAGETPRPRREPRSIAARPRESRVSPAYGGRRRTRIGASDAPPAPTSSRRPPPDDGKATDDAIRRMGEQLR